MTSQSISLSLQERETIGKGLTALRNDGKLPAVIHDHGKPSLHVMGDYISIAKAYEAAGKHHPIELKIGNKQRLTLIKDVDFEPVKRRMRHVVFQAIRQDEKVEAEIPILIDGDIPAEKLGLMVIKHLDTVMVEALPKDLPDELKIDPSSLQEIGDKITVAELQVPEGVTIMTDPEHPVAGVEETKAQVSEETTEETGEEGTEGEETGESDETPSTEETTD